MAGTPHFMRLIRERTEEQFTKEPESEFDRQWWRRYAPKWRNRVGIPRLIAEAAFNEALTLIRQVNRGLFRSNPEMRDRYDAALHALDELASAFSRENWAKFNREQGGE